MKSDTIWRDTSLLGSKAKNKELLYSTVTRVTCVCHLLGSALPVIPNKKPGSNQELHFADAIPIDNTYELPIQSHNMDSTPSPTSSDSSSQFFASSPDFPPVPDHIIVTFDGKVREMLRITRDEVEEERQSRPTTSRPRYYAGRAFSRPESN
ncbi:hypothetical protein J1614_005923 [Plenodomus biglobosus]|nr:hypothetical protein J1614_005923 [Plenodomus biglobosus]